MNKSGSTKDAARTSKPMAKYQPEHLARLERRIKIAVGFLPEEAPVQIPVKQFSKMPARLWPQRQARPFSSNGAQSLRR